MFKDHVERVLRKGSIPQLQQCETKCKATAQQIRRHIPTWPALAEAFEYDATRLRKQREWLIATRG